MSISPRAISFLCVLLLKASITSSQSFSSFACGEHWLLRYNDTQEVAVRFENWLYAWQNTCDKPIRPHPVPTSGIGATVNEALKWFTLSIESHMIYRPLDKNMKNQPPGIWLWADNDPHNCTLHLRSLDCYLQPLSVCSIDEGSVYHQRFRMAQDIQRFSPSNIDSCGMAKIAAKPLQWVLAHMIAYFLRYKDNIQKSINSRVSEVIGSSFDPKSTTIGIHIRGGKPDSGRQVLNVSDYMVYVDTIAAKMLDAGRPVSIVYLCSHVQEENIVSAEHMAQMFPGRKFSFKVLSHLSLGPGEAQRSLEKDSNVDKQRISMEFFADIEIFAAVDYFIGSVSSMNTLVSGLRIARPRVSPLHQNMTCILDFHSEQSAQHALHCEGSEFVKGRWRNDHGGFRNSEEANDFFDPNLYFPQ